MLYSDEARASLMKGIEILYKTVACTLGPMGRTVVLERAPHTPTITKDGVSVAKEIELSNPYHNMGSRLIRESSGVISDTAGDGTTTTTVLTYGILKRALMLIREGMEIREFQAGMRLARDLILQNLEDLMIPVESERETYRVALISSNGDEEVAQILKEAVLMAGSEGIVVVEEGKSSTHEILAVDGMTLDRGWLSDDWTDEGSRKGVLVDPYVLVTDIPLESARPLLEVLEWLLQENQSLLVVAPDFSFDVIATFRHNRSKLPAQLIKAPSFGSHQLPLLEDLAIFTGARLISKQQGMGLDKVDVGDLGICKRVEVSHKETLIQEGCGNPEEIADRVAGLRYTLEQSGSQYDQEKLRDRIAKLSGGVVTIKVGAWTETQMKETKARIEDAVHAVQAAIQDGVVVGGGTAAFRAGQLIAQDLYPTNPTELEGFKTVIGALQDPIKVIAQNGGYNGDLTVQKVLANPHWTDGFNVMTGEIENLWDSGILDPYRVVKLSIEAAVSVASTVVAAEVLITKKS